MLNLMKTKNQRAHWLSLALLIPGCFSMIGYLSSLPALQGFGFALGLSPLPRVFGTAIEPQSGIEFETFSVQSELLYRDAHGTEHTITPSRQVMQSIAGPYARRNAYGAVVCYAPALPEKLRERSLHYALISPGTMRAALGLTATDMSTELRLRARTRDEWHTFSTPIR
jgi:hypothetical protein